MSDDKKVFDLTMRRQEQLQNDPILALANKLTKIVAESATDMQPVNQLVAIELTARALIETVRHARGDVALNEIIVEFQHKCGFYTMGWPEHDQSATVYDQAEEPPIAIIVPLKRDEEE
jgi:hypothetical protein